MKQLLTKLVYGIEIDYHKTPFGILAGQVKGDSVCNNGGWYNINGEKIGSGDLSMKDLQTISKHIPSSEVFLILSEYDAAFNMPSHLDRHEPGKDYVLSKALWVVGKDTGGIILRVGDRNDKPEEDERDGVKYTKLSRKEFKKSLAGNQSPSKDKKITASNSEEEQIKNMLYDLYKKNIGQSQQSITQASQPVATPNPPRITAAIKPVSQKNGKFLTAAVPGMQKSTSLKKKSSSP
jgi:hypothetical protein